jgi:phosphate/sulfate permease
VKDKLLHIGKKTGIISLKILITILVILIALMALMPLVTLYAGIISVVGVNLAWYFYFRNHSEPNKLYHFWYRMGIFAMVLGFFFHLGCRFYSSYKVHKLHDECVKEKSNIYLNSKIDANQKIIQPKSLKQKSETE